MDPVDEAYRRLATEVIKQAALDYREKMISPAIRDEENPALMKSLQEDVKSLRRWFYGKVFALYAPGIDPDYIVQKLDEDVEQILKWPSLPYLIVPRPHDKYGVVKADDWAKVLAEHSGWEYASEKAAKLTGVSRRIYSLAYHRLCKYGFCPVTGERCGYEQCDKFTKHGCAVIVPSLKKGLFHGRGKS